MIKKKVIPPDYEGLAVILRNKRIANNYSVEELARYAGVGVRTVERYETGHINVHGTQFAQIVKCLKLNRTTTVWEALGFDIEDTQVWSPGFYLREDQ